MKKTNFLASKLKIAKWEICLIFTFLFRSSLSIGFKSRKLEKKEKKLIEALFREKVYLIRFQNFFLFWNERKSERRSLKFSNQKNLTEFFAFSSKVLTPFVSPAGFRYTPWDCSSTLDDPIMKNSHFTGALFWHNPVGNRQRQYQPMLAAPYGWC